MSKRKKPPEPNKVEVDMVPLIDIISLVLMFLIIVGDTAASANNVAMRLPRADQGKTDEQLAKEGFRTDGRIVIQLKPDDPTNPAKSKYGAVIMNKKYELVPGGNNKSLSEFLTTQINFSLQRGDTKKNDDNTVTMPVKLRVPDEAPMKEVERIVVTLAQVGLVNVQYAATNK